MALDSELPFINRMLNPTQLKQNDSDDSEEEEENVTLYIFL